jgi:hypothetical protein
MSMAVLVWFVNRSSGGTEHGEHKDHEERTARLFGEWC